MKILAIGFPRDHSVPTRVTACGDGIHTAVAHRAADVDCVCGRHGIGLSKYEWMPYPFRVLLVDAAMDGATIGDSRRIRGRMVAS